MDQKQAYEILGVSENATKEEIEHRYSMLLKKSRTRQQRGEQEGTSSSPDDRPVDVTLVNSAYKFIMGLEQQKFREDYSKKHYSRFRNEKLDHFIHYYKFHVLISIVVIIAIIYGINTYIDKREERKALALLPPIDLSVMFYGDYYAEAEPPLEQSILASMPGWQRVKVTVTPVPEQARSEFDIALQQKAMIALMTEKPDIYIVDKTNFDRLVRQGAFYKLDDFGQSLQDRLTTDIKMTAQTEDDTQPHLYGIDVSTSPLLKNLPITSMNGQFIAVMRMDTQHQEQAFAYIRKLLES